MDIQSHLAEIITAVGGLGTAAFGLVDTSKALWGGPSNFGFRHIALAIAYLYPPAQSDGKEQAAGRPADKDRRNPLSAASTLLTLKANWLNGRPLADQKAIAKSLVKLALNAENAPYLAGATGVDAEKLAAVAKKISSGEALTKQEADIFGRFDLVVTTLLDEAYQRADQQYRNATKLLSAFVSVALALLGGAAISADGYWGKPDMWEALIIGLLATPLAPVSKDLASALSAAIKAVQLTRK